MMERPAQNRHALQWCGTEGLFHVFGQGWVDLLELINTTIIGEPTIVFEQHAEVSLTSIQTPDYGPRHSPVVPWLDLMPIACTPGPWHRTCPLGPCQEQVWVHPGCWGLIRRLRAQAQQGLPPMVGLRGGCEGIEIPVACWQQALCTIVPVQLACGRLSFRHGHGLPVPRRPV